MRAYGSLRRRNEFARIQRRGQRRAGRHVVVLSLPSRDGSRVGIAVAKAVGNAVVRNRLRRRIKAVLDGARFGAPPYRDVVVIARPGAGAASFAEIAAELGALLP